MQTQLPEVGKTYQSQAQPSLVMRVVTVEAIPDTADHFIEASPPGSDEITDYITDEWNAHHFKPASE